jgi:hypothetical protein
MTLVAAVACAVLAFLWPTAWRQERAGGMLVRVNRFTGHPQVLCSEGWRSLPPGVAVGGRRFDRICIALRNADTSDILRKIGDVPPNPRP